MNYEDKYVRDLLQKVLAVEAAEAALKVFVNAGAETYWPKMALENAKNSLKEFKEWHRVHCAREMLCAQALAKLSSEERAAVSNGMGSPARTALLEEARSGSIVARSCAA